MDDFDMRALGSLEGTLDALVIQGVKAELDTAKITDALKGALELHLDDIPITVRNVVERFKTQGT